MRVNHQSMAVVRIFPHSDITGVRLSSATGFIVLHKNVVFLVTNWHVVTGKHFETKKPIIAGARVSAITVTANCINIHEHPEIDVNSFAIDRLAIVQQDFRIDLPMKNDEADVDKYTNPIYGSDVDVVAIPIMQEWNSLLQRGLVLRPLLVNNGGRFPDVTAMHPVFIPGFPNFKGELPNDFPIYKAGHIATEPNLVAGKPFFMIDGKTKAGWSGSPVLVNPGAQQMISTWSLEVGDKRAITTDKTLYAVYSGRIDVDKEFIDAELAIAWPVSQCLIPILDRLAT